MTRRQVLFGLPFVPLLWVQPRGHEGEMMPTNDLAVRGADGVPHRVMVERAAWKEPRYVLWNLNGNFLTKKGA